MASNIVLSTQEFKVVGTSPIRPDGADKVTGRARYSADIHLPGLLHAKVLRSPYPHARILRIDATRALALEGVKAVVTAADLPQSSGKMADLGEGAMVNPKFMSNNVLAADKALYKGHAIAAVAAVNAHVADEALSLIDVEYEVLAPVTDVVDAMKADAPVLHEGLATQDTWGPMGSPGGLLADAASAPGTNVANHFLFEVGDPDEGFKQADVIVEREYHTESVHQGYIEPQCATAMWDTDGNLTIWCSSQGHFSVRDATASVLSIPVSRIRVVPMEIGGGFGGKLGPYLEPLAALLSKKTARPVKLAMTRAEVFEGTGPTSGSHMRVKVGANRSGKITAVDAMLAYDAGAYPGSPVNAGAQCMFGPYDLSNGRVEGFDVVVNKPKTQAYRAPGAPAAAYAAESVLDEVAEKLGIDPLELRLKNGAVDGTRQLPGPMFGKIGLMETLRAAKEHPHYSAPLEGPNRGRGVAAGFWRNNTGPASAIASVNADGTVSLVEGSPDIGGSRASAAMHVAEVLGLTAEEIKPTVGDTSSIGFTSPTGGSGVTFKTGWACYEAAQDVGRQMVQRAARVWDITADEVDFTDGVFHHRSDPELRLTFKELSAKLNDTGGPVVGRAAVNPRGAGGAFAVHIVDVEVDPDTGKVQILRFTAIQDAGKAIHPGYVEGQMQGGVSQGVGWALNEEYFYNDRGEMANPTFLDYRMPTSLDLPMIDTVIVEVANPGHPYGVRGVGEVPIVPPMAAVANAIYHATGVRMQRLPMSPGAVLEALWEHNGQK